MSDYVKKIRSVTDRGYGYESAWINNFTQARFDIRKNGEVVHSTIGANPEDALNRALEWVDSQPTQLDLLGGGQ